MPLLSITLAPEAVGRLYDALLCLGKFSETVSLEAQRNKLVLSALNPSKSAYASFTFDGGRFFARYQFASSQASPSQARNGGPAQFSCQLYNKALVSVFRGRLLDARDRDTSVERCELSIQEGPQRAECRLVVKMICRHGVVKTSRLTYESVEVMHALFDRATAANRWSIAAGALKDFSEHFGPKTEQLDMYPENGRCIFTSYTEKVMNGKEVLKQSLQTSVAVDTLEFEEFSVEDKLHVVINVRDFKAIVYHAESLGAIVSASYSHAMRPMQITYDSQGMSCEFTLMTTGEPPPSATQRGSFVGQRPSVQPGRSAGRGIVTTAARSESTTPVPAAQRPPARISAQTSLNQGPRRPSPPPPKASVDDTSLFFPEGDDEDDQQWNAYNSEHETEDLLGWDASGVNSRSQTFIRRQEASAVPNTDQMDHSPDEQPVAPTQRISQVPGIFDDI